LSGRLLSSCWLTTVPIDGDVATSGALVDDGHGLLHRRLPASVTSRLRDDATLTPPRRR
jgi:hypothetical protein